MIDYASPGALTEIDPVFDDFVRVDVVEPADVGAVVQQLISLPPGATEEGVAPGREHERSLRPTNAILACLRDLDPAPIRDGREASARIIGTCRHFALLTTALLRHNGKRARARCGFAGYFVPDRYVDHWICESWSEAEQRWVRIDSEILGLSIVETPDDLADGEFLTGGEAWCLVRDHGADPAHFGVHGTTDAWGIGEIRGNAIRDLAAMNKVEMLPWDEWSRMAESYRGETDAAFDRLIDRIADVCAADDDAALKVLYATEDLTVPPELLATP